MAFFSVAYLSKLLMISNQTDVIRF